MRWSTIVLLALVGSACASKGSDDDGTSDTTAGDGTGDSEGDWGGNCVVDEDCPGRGQSCVDENCVTEDGAHDSTDDDAPPSGFTDKPIPFFRGQICTAPNLQVRTGSQIPVSYKPCLHPCITSGDNFVSHQWGCLAGLCSALGVFYTVGSGLDCPAQAWGEFAKDQCVYDTEMNLGLGPLALDGSPVEGVLRLEIPFLTNTDIARYDTYRGYSVEQMQAEASSQCSAVCDGAGPPAQICLPNCLAKELAHQYVEDEDRILTFELADDHPAPPDDCTGNPDCECFEIGFQ